jgi:hypothetical protein
MIIFINLKNYFDTPKIEYFFKNLIFFHNLKNYFFNPLKKNYNLKIELFSNSFNDHQITLKIWSFLLPLN